MTEVRTSALPISHHIEKGAPDKIRAAQTAPCDWHSSGRQKSAVTPNHFSTCFHGTGSGMTGWQNQRTLTPRGMAMLLADNPVLQAARDYWCDQIGRASCRERVCQYV